MGIACLIVAAGRGTRLGGPVPKQYRPLGRETVLAATLRAVLASDRVDQVRVVIHPDDAEIYAQAVAPIDDGRLAPPVHGADTRAGSVAAGLRSLNDAPPRYVLIHDAARPFVSTATIDAVIDALGAGDGAFPALAVADALWDTAGGLSPRARDGLVRTQTPQGFGFDRILAAHAVADARALDDVEIAVAAGLTVTPVSGDPRNFKITTQADLERACDMHRDTIDIRTGTGFDVHAFTDGDAVVLNGITIPHTRALKGHSDADVAMHAITDAIYGALAEGDIGQWFPPSDPQWKGAASDIFLKHAMERAAARGFTITHIDCTIICEHPKIGPHATAMRETLSGLTGLEMERISVKATTSEQLGFTGRGEGIAAQAVATLVKP